MNKAKFTVICITPFLLGLLIGRYWRTATTVGHDAGPVVSIAPDGSVFQISVAGGQLGKGMSLSIMFDALFQKPNQTHVVWVLEDNGKIIGRTSSFVTLKNNEETIYPSQVEWLEIKDQLRWRHQADGFW